jgi:hypothetical protein
MTAPRPRRPSPLVLAPVLAAGCVTVTPAQRQDLSRPEMTPATDAVEEVWHTHVEAAREAGFGGHGAAGGGCGCG